MRFIASAKIFLTTTLLLLFSAKTFAYDIDTHFYEMYLLARYAGINHEVSLRYATLNEWIDQSSWTSPMFPTLIIGGRMRRFHHFPMEIASYNNIQNTPSHGAKVNILGVVKENNPFASEAITEGMKTGNDILVGQGLHTLMDSYGHSGWSFEGGHTEGAHWPDRPWAFYEKHQRMVQTLFKALTAIRQLLPENALDKTFARGSTPQYLLNAQQLTEQYNNDQNIQSLIQKDPLRTTEYTSKALAFILTTAKKKGLFQKDYDLSQLLNENYIQEGLTTREILAHVITDLLAKPHEERIQILDRDWIQNQLLTGVPLDKIAVEDLDQHWLLEQITSVLTDGLIPVDISKDNPVSFEFGVEIRNHEMEIRLNNWQDLIASETGKHIRFEPKKIPDFLRGLFAKLRSKDPLVEINDMEVATLHWPDRFRWMWTQFKYMYLDIALKLNPRWRANQMNMLYQYDGAFQDLIKNGVVKELLSERQVDKIIQTHRAKLVAQGYVAPAPTLSCAQVFRF